MQTAVIFPESRGGILDNLKRPLLLFDRIAVHQLSGYLKLLDKLDDDYARRMRAELDWLGGQGVLQALETEYAEDWFTSAAEHHPNIPPDAMDFASSMSERTFWAL